MSTKHAEFLDMMVKIILNDMGEPRRYMQPMNTETEMLHIAAHSRLNMEETEELEDMEMHEKAN